MSGARYLGHYLPVEARRSALTTYRLIRRNGRPPAAAIYSTIDFYGRHLAWIYAFDPESPARKSMLDGYRAASWYCSRLRTKPWYLDRPGPGGSR